VIAFLAEANGEEIQVQHRAETNNHSADTSHRIRIWNQMKKIHTHPATCVTPLAGGRTRLATA
jgi:hypothetical protein